MFRYITMEFDKNAYKRLLKNPKGLSSQLKMSPEMRDIDISKYIDKENAMQSAVLILIYKKDDKLFLLLTERSNNLLKHRGQISFPGGKKDEIDSNLFETAIREAKEEIGLYANVELLGELTPLLIPITDFCVHQFVVYIPQLPKLEINTEEVEKLLEIPIEDLLDNKNIGYKSFGPTTSGRQISAPYYNINGIEIWGATAMMISELLDSLFPQ